MAASSSCPSGSSPDFVAARSCTKCGYKGNARPCPDPDCPSRSAATVEWERFDYDHGETIWQRECPECDRGLLLAPARFCGRCDGSGYLTTTVDPEAVAS